MSMPTDCAETEPRGTRQFLLVWFALTVVAVLAHFVFFPRMGLYADDHWLIGVPMCEWNSARDLFQSWKDNFATYFQGRPLNMVIGNTLTYISTHAAGLPGAFVLAMAIWSMNAGLCLALLWRRFGPTTATVATLFFILFPADTTHAALHVAFCVQPSVTFLLLSGIAYSRGRYLFSVVLAGLTLITYETCFLPALAWPLLFAGQTHPLWRRCLTHGLAMALVLVLAITVRLRVGEARASDALKDRQGITAKVKQLATIGPRSSGATFISRPAWIVQAWLTRKGYSGRGPGRTATITLTAITGLAALFALAMARRRFRDAGPSSAGGSTPDVGSPLFLRLIVAGALMVTLGYIAGLNREPSIISGRMSSVHIGAALGWCVLLAGLFAGLGRLLSRVRLGFALVPVLVVHLSLLAGFHLFVQREYIRAWSAQREFWRDVVRECPDVRAGTVIFFPHIKQTSEMASNQEWADYFIFKHLFVVPAGWAAPPRAFVVTPGWATDPNRFARQDGKLYWVNPCGHRALLEQENVILLRHTPSGRFERETGTIRVAGEDLKLKPREGAAFPFEPHRLYWAMFPRGLKRELSGHVSGSTVRVP